MCFFCKHIPGPCARAWPCPLRHLYMHIFCSSIAAEKNTRQHNNKHQSVKLLEQHTRPLIKANWVVFGALVHTITQSTSQSTTQTARIGVFYRALIAVIWPMIDGHQDVKSRRSSFRQPHEFGRNGEIRARLSVACKFYMVIKQTVYPVHQHLSSCFLAAASCSCLCGALRDFVAVVLDGLWVKSSAVDLSGWKWFVLVCNLTILCKYL